MNNTQIDMFSVMYPKFVINKPIMLIETFSGIGAQAKALENLGVEFKHHKAIEFDKHAMASYNAIHGTNFETSDIRNIHAEDLEITERDKYCYILTYSFPCQDLSVNGLMRGMKKGSGTRSGLLWEIERILDECGTKLPQVLLMENVPQVIGKNNIKDFQAWRAKLETLGYSNYVQLLNAKDYGIPQNRNRCFMVSILGKYSYTFPKKQPLKTKLGDVLEKNVDHKYYLSEKAIHGAFNTKFQCAKAENRMARGGIMPTILARDYKDPKLCIDNGICVPEQTKKGNAVARGGDGIYIDRPHQKRGTVQKDMIPTIKTSVNDLGVVVDEG